jgi:hypothetical protein
MNRRFCSTACFTTLLLTATAWGQSNGLDTTGTSASSDTSAVTGVSSAAATTQPSFKQQLRSELAQLVVDEIHNIFLDIRKAFGLPEVPTDPTTDPLALLETAITGLVEAKLAK